VNGPKSCKQSAHDIMENTNRKLVLTMILVRHGCLRDRAGVTLRHRVHAGDLLISRQPLLDEVHHGIEGPVVPVVRGLCGRVFE
jgi:hypothetical protein